MNRTIKDGVKAALVDGQSFTTAVRQTLAAYRTTPQSSTGVSPATLMLAYPVRTPLSLLQQSAGKPTSSLPPSSTSPMSASGPPSSVVETVRKRVRIGQAKMADYHDRRKHARPTQIKAGDQVRILLPVRAHKLAPKYSDLHRVVRASNNTVWLENGQRWNVRRLLLRRSSSKQSPTLPSSPLPVQPTVTSSRDIQIESDVDEQSPTFTFPSRQQQQQRTQRQGHTQQQPHPQQLRRSQRQPKPRDFGPVISH